MGTGHGEKLSRLQERAVAALLSRGTVKAAAQEIGINEKTLRTWLKQPPFAAAFRSARRGLVETAIGQIQIGLGRAVHALLTVAKDGKKDADRVRASIALLEFSLRGLADADALHGGPETGDGSEMGTTDVVKVLAARLRQVDAAELPTAEKAKLTATLADALLRAIGVDVLDQRLAELQAVLQSQKRKK